VGAGSEVLRIAARESFRACPAWIGLFAFLLPLVPPASARAAEAWEGLRYEIAIEVDVSSGTFAGTEEIAFTNGTGLALEEIFLRLYPNASSLYGEGELRATGVTLDGESVPAEPVGDGTILWIRLPRPVQTGEQARVGAAFTGRPARWGSSSGASPVGYGTFASSPRATVLTSFFPMLAAYDEDGWDIAPVASVGDPVTSQAAAFLVRVTVPADVTVLTSGELVQEEVGPAGATRSYAGAGLRDFAVVLGGTRLEKAARSGDTLVRVSFTPEHVRAAEITLAHATTALAVYREAFGPCVYGELDLVEVPLDRAAGVEFPSLILIGEAYAADPDDLFFDIIVSHEVAHQWWYAAVGNDVVEEPWLDEGLAMFSSLLFLERTRGPTIARQVLDSWERTYVSVRGRRADLSVASPTYQFPDSDTYASFVYDGGASFFQDVREATGDTAFFDALRGYYRDQTGKIATQSDLLPRLEAACSCSLSSLVSSYLRPR